MPTATTNLQAEMLHLARQQGKTAFLQANNANTGFVMTINGATVNVTAGEISGLANAAAGRTMIKSKLSGAGVKSPY